MERCIVLCARRYSFKDDGGKQVDGTTLSYLTGDKENGADRKGLEPLTISGDQRLFLDLQELPGVYELDFKQRPGKNGRPTLQVTSARFLGASLVGAELTD